MDLPEEVRKKMIKSHYPAYNAREGNPMLEYNNPGGKTVYGIDYGEFGKMSPGVKNKILQTKGEGGDIFKSLTKEEFMGLPQEVRKKMIADNM